MTPETVLGFCVTVHLFKQTILLRYKYDSGLLTYEPQQIRSDQARPKLVCTVLEKDKKFEIFVFKKTRSNYTCIMIIVLFV